MEKDILINEEIVGGIIAHFMKQNNLTKFSLFARLKSEDTMDFDMIGG